MREAFAVQKLLTLFQQKYWHISDINIWKFNISLTNDVVSFEQLGPADLPPPISIFNTVIPILMPFYMFSRFKKHFSALKAGTLGNVKPGPEVIKLFPHTTQLSMKF